MALLEAFARLLPLGLPDAADRHLAWATDSRPVFVSSGPVLSTVGELVKQDNRRISFAPRKAPGVIRVFCVGDSTTAGWPYHPAGAYPRWLAAILSDARPDLSFEVINAGFHGFDSTRCLSVIRELSADAPDLFVLHAGYDDFHLYPMRSNLLFPAHRWLMLHYRTYDLMRWLLGRRAGIFSLQPPAPALSPAQEDAMIAAFAANVETAESLGRASGAAVLLTDLPHAPSADWKGIPSLERMRSAQRTLARERGWPLVELGNVEDDARFFDHVHSDAEGYRLIALDVAREIQRAGLLPGRWRWERLRSPRRMAADLGLDAPEFQAHLHVRFAEQMLNRNRPDRAVDEIAAALAAAPNATMVPEEIRGSGDERLISALKKAQAARSRP